MRHGKYFAINPEMARLCDEIAELWSHISAATARFLELLGRLDEDGYLEDGYKSLAHWLSWRCGIALGTAQDYVRTGQRLRERPLIKAAMELGELSYSKVRALMRLEEDFDEELALMYALHASASQIETIVRGCRRCVRVEGGAERAFMEREFSWHYDDEGGVAFHGRLPTEQGPRRSGAHRGVRCARAPAGRYRRGNAPVGCGARALAGSAARGRARRSRELGARRACLLSRCAPRCRPR
jgi:hypothetical protein